MQVHSNHQPEAWRSHTLSEGQQSACMQVHVQYLGEQIGSRAKPGQAAARLTHC